MRQPKTRSGYQKHEPYPLNQFPQDIIEALAKRIVHLIAVGHADMSGDIFGQMFADTISGQAFGKSLGVADVAWNGCGWSVKTVKDNYPHGFTVGPKGKERPKRIRLISGRNNVTYSFGIEAPLANVKTTGDAVVEIYNHRIAKAREEHDDIRLVVLIRNMSTLEFTIFERPMVPLAVNDYQWEINDRGKLEGFCEGKHVFTWQPDGSQFTIKEQIPTSATRFKITKRPPMLQIEHVIRLARYKPDWVKILGPVT